MVDQVIKLMHVSFLKRARSKLDSLSYYSAHACIKHVILKEFTDRQFSCWCHSLIRGRPTQAFIARPLVRVC